LLSLAWIHVWVFRRRWFSHWSARVLGRVSAWLIHNRPLLLGRTLLVRDRPLGLLLLYSRTLLLWGEGLLPGPLLLLEALLLL